MSQQRHKGSEGEKTTPKSRRRRHATANKAPVTEVLAPVKEVKIREAGEAFITREDLSHFLSIKPYLTDKAQTIVDLLGEIQRTGGKLDQSSLMRLLGLFGQSNMSALASLASLANSGGKMDPAGLASLLGGVLGQMNAGAPAKKE